MKILLKSLGNLSVVAAMIRAGFFRLLIASVAISLVVLSLPLAAQEKDISDEDITSAVETELWIDDVVNMNTIDVETKNGVVTFTGTANNILAKERSEEIAETILGVRAIVNLIKVKPGVYPTDVELKNDVEEALLRDPATESYEVQVSTNDGVVTLSGKVDSWQEKQLCATVAKGVKGVKKVDNQLDFTYETNRWDSDLEKEINARLKNDVHVDDYLIEVEVKDAEVELSGTVGSLAEKNRAISDSWVAGVKKVVAEDLDIKWWARDEMRRKSLYEERDDDEIKNAVKAAFLYDPRVISFNPEVKVNNGTVTLKGVVNNLKAKEAAEEDAKNVIGVWRVKNHLKVKPPVIPTDKKLEEQISKALISDPYVDRYDITIDVKNGIAYLVGKVNTSFEKLQAESIAETVSGVFMVVNNLDYDFQWEWKPDGEIKDNVEEQMEWSLFVDGSDIDINVNNGIVTLNGEVHNWSEYNAAEKNAYEGGAKDVMNELTISHPFYYGPMGRYPFYPGPLFK